MGVWPHGKRCAVVLSFDVDGELIWKVWHSGEPSQYDLSLGRYGPRVGLPRILGVLKRCGVRGTFFTPGWIAEKYPDIIRETANVGHEIAHHGYKHEINDNMSLDEERAMLEKGIDALKNVVGKTPRGYRMGRSPNTVKLLSELGFIYDSSLLDDDMPYRITEDGHATGVVELPWSLTFNDTTYMLYSFSVKNKPLLMPREVYGQYCDGFDMLYKEGRFCMFTLHPEVIGHPARALMLEKTIRYMQKRRGVWFATAGEVAEQIKKQVNA